MSEVEGYKYRLNFMYRCFLTKKNRYIFLFLNSSS